MPSQRYRPELDINQLIYVLSHDLQAPPRALRQYLSLFKSECGANFPGDSERYANRMDNVLDKLDQQLEALLTLSRFSRPQGDIHEHAPAELMLKIMADRSLNAEIADDLPTIKCDQPRLMYFLGELVDNVIHHAGPDAKISFTHDGEWFHFSDTGQGVPERVRDEVFMVFRPVSRSGTERLGMGLCNCNSILRSLGGCIELECPDSGGTTIWFKL